MPEQLPNAYRDFKRVQNRSKYLEDIIRRTGNEPPPEEGKGWLSSGLDFLDTGGQWIRGDIAKMVGVPEYENLGWLEAAKHANARDISVGDILKSKDILQGEGAVSAVGRGVATFLGDVATDPMTYVTFGGGLGIRAGGKALSGEALKTSEGISKLPIELFEDIAHSKAKPLVQKAEKRVARMGLQGKDAQYLIEQAQRTAEEEADYVFKVARSVSDGQRKLEKAAHTGLNDLIKDPFKVQEKADWVAEQLRLQSSRDVSKLFAKPAVRFVPEGIAGKAIGTALFVDDYGNIPFLTTQSENLFRAMGNLTFNANVKVGKALAKGVEFGRKLPGGGAAADFAKVVGDTVSKFPSLFSRRIQAGGKHALMNLTENEAHRAVLAYRVDKEKELLFQAADGKMFDENIMTDAVRSFERSIVEKEKMVKSLKLQGIKRKKLDAILEERFKPEEIFNKQVQKLQKKYNLEKPGLGDSLAHVMRNVSKDFDEWGAEEESMGILGQVIDGYVKHAYIETPKMSIHQALPGLKRGMANMQEGVPGSSFHRVISSIDKARTMGLEPIVDLSELWRIRKYQHEAAKLDLRFSEKLAYQFALPKTTLAKVTSLITSHNEKKALEAREFVRQHGISLTLDDIVKNATTTDGAKASLGILNAPRAEDAITKAMTHDPVWGVPRYKNGMALNPKGYDYLAQVAHGEISVAPSTLEHAEEEIKHMGLTFSREEGEAFRELYKNYDDAKLLVLDRMGEGVVARASTDVLPQKIRGLIEKARKSGHIDPASADFFQGVLPANLRNAVNESYETRGMLRRILDNADKTGATVPAREGLEKIAKLHSTWLNGLKKGYTMFWLAFYARNLGSAQFQMMKSARILGDSLNPMRVWETYAITHEKAGLQTARGFVSASKLNEEMREAGVAIQFDSLAELTNAWADSLSEMKHVNQLADKLKTPHAISIKDKMWGAGKKFTTRVENYGRQHLYLSLRKQGHTAASAAEITNRTMIDYARGKTAFERDIMNNIIFFYAFSRGEASNTLTALLTRPGALTAQLHAVDGISETLRDPNANPLPINVEDAAETLRSSETISRVVGTSDRGYPIVMNRAGMPIEDISRFINLKTPRNYTFNGLLNAGIESSGRTLKTLLSQVNPILRTPIEVATNKNLFFDRPLTDRSIRKIAKIFPQVDADWDKLKGLDWRRIPAGIVRGLNNATQTILAAKDNHDGTFTAHPTRLAAVALIPWVGRGINTTRALANQKVDLGNRIGSQVLGIKVSEIDPLKSRAYDRQKQLEDFINYEVLPRSKREALRQERIAAQLRDEDR